MKKVNKNYFARPYSLESVRAPYHSAINKVLSNRGWLASTLYRSNSIKIALQGIYNGKCAFCEQVPIGSPAQVEHFRPKDGINGVIHTGYYWLAFDWSNLLLACGNCNSSKGTHFQIFNEGARVTEPSVLSDGIDEDANFIRNIPLILERPKLLNPEIDNPQKHLVYTPDGEVVHLSDMGEESKIRYNLNRDELFVNGRKKKKDDIEIKFLKRLDRYQNGERGANIVITELIDVINEDILKPISENLSFSEYFKQMLLYFDDFFIIGDPKSAILLRHSFLKVINELQK